MDEIKAGEFWEKGNGFFFWRIGKLNPRDVSDEDDEDDEDEGAHTWSPPSTTDCLTARHVSVSKRRRGNQSGRVSRGKRERLFQAFNFAVKQAKITGLKIETNKPTVTAASITGGVNEAPELTAANKSARHLRNRRKQLTPAGTLANRI